MPKTSERPAETRKRSPASVSALRSCSPRFATRGAPGGPLREVLGATLRRHLLARIGRQDLGDRVWILRILHRLDGEAELDRLVIALAHEERALEALVARVFQASITFSTSSVPAFWITWPSHSSPSYVSPSNMSG